MDPDTPGKPWNFTTGRLTKIQSPINRFYFDKLEYVKVPAVWPNIMLLPTETDRLLTLSSPVAYPGTPGLSFLSKKPAQPPARPRMPVQSPDFTTTLLSKD